MNDNVSTWLVPVLLAIAAAAVAWYFWNEDRPAPPAPVVQPTMPVQEQQPSDEPRYPVEPAMPERPAAENLAPLPALDDSDRYFELAIADVFGSGIEQLLVDTALIEKIVATVDNLPRDRVAERIRPIERISGPYLVDGQDGSGEYTVNPASYERYDFLVNMLAVADLPALVDTYRRFYPLFQEAYVNLGYPDGYFNDRLVEVINHLLETPEPDGLPELTRPHVLFEYADPDLEALSGGQKMILRAGPDHALRIKQFLEELRDAVSRSDPA